MGLGSEDVERIIARIWAEMGMDGVAPGPLEGLQHVDGIKTAELRKAREHDEDILRFALRGLEPDCVGAAYDRIRPLLCHPAYRSAPEPALAEATRGSMGSG